MLPFKGEAGDTWPRMRLQHNIVMSELSDTDGVWGHEAASRDAGTANPANHRIVAP